MMHDPSDPPEVRVEKQAKIIDALIRRANRQGEAEDSAFRAFQSAIELRERLEARGRDLRRAETELESVRLERERTRRSLVEALSSMAEGFALFMDGRLSVCNELIGNLLPDVATRIAPGIEMPLFFRLMTESAHFAGSDSRLRGIPLRLKRDSVASAVVELRGDRWFQLNAQRTSPDNAVLLITEITDLVRRNRDEKETLIDLQEDYLQAVFQNMSSGVGTFSAKGALMLRNARFREMLDLPSAALRPGMTLRAFLGLLKSKGFRERGSGVRIRDWLAELNSRGRLLRRVRQGAEQVIDIQANRLPDGGYVIELKDVTLEVRSTETLENRVATRTAELTRANERLVEEYAGKARVEEELRLAKEKAEAAMSSKTRFLAAASHDLLQPINAAKLLISILSETTRDTEHAPMMERLSGAFESAERVLHSLLDISRLESAEADALSVSTVSLGALLAGIHGDQALVAERKNVRLDVAPSSAFARSDPVYLLRSVQNLVVNAIQYTEPGGRVLVGCRRRNADRVEIQVWDTGVGIAPADQKRIFEEFARAEGVPPGTGLGLGLSVVDRACRILGHRLTVRSSPGAGSVFGIEMDAAEGDLAAGETAGLSAPADDGVLDRIVMVIENDEDALFGTARWLESCGAVALPAGSTAEALKFVEQAGMPPDIILADYQLDDGETGIEAVARVRSAARRRVPAILVTADRSEEVRAAGMRDDVSVMTKPVKIARLRRLIELKLGAHPPIGGNGALRADADESRRRHPPETAS